MSHSHFNKGDEVEVKREESNKNDDRSTASWHSAIVIRSSSKKKNQIYVEYKTLTSDRSKPLREHVDITNVRPVPPLELHRCFLVGENVDALRDNGWRRAIVLDILENSRYMVKFQDDELIEVEQCNLRLHREWDDGSWVPPLEIQKNLTEMEVKPRQLKLKIKFSKTAPEPKFSVGTRVEVSSEEEGYSGSWYPAKIIGSVGNDKFLVEYLTLKSDDSMEPLREEALVQYIRPIPPEVPSPRHFEQFQEVDAWYNDGWWVGVISKVFIGLNYLVYFTSTRDELEFEHSKLRPHRDWINGKWVIASKENSLECVRPREVKLVVKHSGKESDAMFAKGTKVEVRSEVEGFEDAWFTAIIVGLLGNDVFLVKYLTLTTDDGTEPLKEEAHASCIRPCPPVIQRFDCFRVLEKVDTWYNDGWWVGVVSRVLSELKYIVYFRHTNEELEFDHSNLRPHQEWINGKWVLVSQDKKG